MYWPGSDRRAAFRRVDALRPGLLPVVLMLKENQACVLLEWLESGQARVRFPENGQSSDVLTREALDHLYAGIACI